MESDSITLYSDIGSGLNDKRKGLIKLVKDIPVLNPAKIIVTYRDRLARFGTTIIEVIGEIFGTQLETAKIDKDKRPQSFEEQLVFVIPTKHFIQSISRI